MANKDLLFYTQIMDDPTKQVTITLPSSKDYGSNQYTDNLVIKGYLEEDFMVGGSNNWGKVFEDTNADANGSLAQMQTGMVVGNLDMTRALYKSSEAPKFNFKFFKISTEDNKNMINEVIQLYRTIAPDASVGGIALDIMGLKANLTYQPPLGYNHGVENNREKGYASLKGADLKGTLKASVGNWFTAKYLIVTGLNISWSRATTMKGSPLFAHIEIATQYYKTPTIQEYMRFFKQVSVVEKKK